MEYSVEDLKHFFRKNETSYLFCSTQGQDDFSESNTGCYIEAIGAKKFLIELLPRYRLSCFVVKVGYVWRVYDSFCGRALIETSDKMNAVLTTAQHIMTEGVHMVTEMQVTHINRWGCSPAYYYIDPEE